MSDLLLELSKNPQAKKIIKTLGLPIPLPEVLKRARGPWAERCLADQTVIVGQYGAVENNPVWNVLAHVLPEAGANPLVVSQDVKALEPWKAPGEAFGRPAKTFVPDPEIKLKANLIVFDATKIDEPAQLKALYEFFHPIIKLLARSGRVVVIGRPSGVGQPMRAAAQQALEGFTRALAKEIGRTGATANLLVVEEGAESRLGPVLRFVLSPRSAFLTAQPLRVSAAVKSDEAARYVKPLEGKVVMLTGAARGIGAATAKILAGEGAHVVCVDRPEDDGPTSQLAREIGGSTLLVDVSAPDAAQTIAGDLKKRFGGVDVVIHNAGVTRDKTLARMKEAAWDQAVDINLGAVVKITAALIEGGVLRDGGRVVCLSSVAGLAGNVGQTNYAASKAGLVGWVRALAPSLAERGIALNAVAPGFIETRLTAAIPVAIRQAGRRLAALGQGGLPEDVGQVLVFLSTPGAAALSGQIIRVCGGALIGA